MSRKGPFGVGLICNKVLHCNPRACTAFTLWAAAWNGMTVSVGLLIEAQADVNATDSYGRTPLLFSARMGLTPMAGWSCCRRLFVIVCIRASFLRPRHRRISPSH